MSSMTVRNGPHGFWNQSTLPIQSWEVCLHVLCRKSFGRANSLTQWRALQPDPESKCFSSSEHSGSSKLARKMDTRNEISNLVAWYPKRFQRHHQSWLPYIPKCLKKDFLVTWITLLKSQYESNTSWAHGYKQLNIYIYIYSLAI